MRSIVILGLCLVFLLAGCTKTPNDSSTSTPELLTSEEQGASPSSMIQGQPSEFVARFEIYTNGTKRIFTDTKYHNQSTDVYIERSDPHRIHVKKPGTTWSDFFKTLPMSLTHDCLVTGTKQTFCSNDTHTLRFWLNGVETPDALDVEIQPNDFLKVEYRR